MVMICICFIISQYPKDYLLIVFLLLIITIVFQMAI